MVPTSLGRAPATIGAALMLAVGCHQAALPAAGPSARAALADESFRRQVPASGPSPALCLPEAHDQLLSNGLQVIVSPRPGRRLVGVGLVVRAGSAQDPPAQEGLATFTAEMLRHGTHKRSLEAIALEAEGLGSEILLGAGEDALVVGATALTEHFPAVFDILADVAQNPTFLASEVEWLRTQALGAFDQAESRPPLVAAQVFRRALLGDHPYGHLPMGRREAVAKVTRDDLVGFFARTFQPGNAALVFSGDITQAEAMRLAERGFGRWAGRARGLPAPPTPRPHAPEVLLVDRPGASQSALTVGLVGPARKDPDHYAQAVLNTILGGSFNSRINMNLREDKAITYGAYANFAFLRGPSTWAVNTRVESHATGLAIREIIAEVAHIVAADVSDEELVDAKRMIVRSLPGMFQDIGDVARQFGTLWVDDLPLDELTQVKARVEQVTLADVRRVAGRILDPASLTIVVVGDARLVAADLEALGRGPVRRVAPSGAPLSASEGGAT